MPSQWITHVKAYQSKNGCSYKDAMKRSKSTYNKKKTPVKKQKKRKGGCLTKQKGAGAWDDFQKVWSKTGLPDLPGVAIARFIKKPSLDSAARFSPFYNVTRDKLQDIKQLTKRRK